MKNRLISLAIAASVFLLDRITKLVIQARVTEWDSIPVIKGFFNIVHSENRGAAFGFLNDAPDAWRAPLLVGLSTAILILLAVLLWKPASGGLHDNAVLRTAIALIFGGALGNLYDRAFLGSVTDFLQFFFGSYEFASFNVADSCITIGAGLMIIDMWRSRKAAPAVTQAEPPQPEISPNR
ncbi:MAG: signal peptidase II [Bryobacteraceae bacterium]